MSSSFLGMSLAELYLKLRFDSVMWRTSNVTNKLHPLALLWAFGALFFIRSLLSVRAISAQALEGQWIQTDVACLMRQMGGGKSSNPALAEKHQLCCQSDRCRTQPKTTSAYYPLNLRRCGCLMPYADPTPIKVRELFEKLTTAPSVKFRKRTSNCNEAIEGRY